MVAIDVLDRRVDRVARLEFAPHPGPARPVPGAGELEHTALEPERDQPPMSARSGRHRRHDPKVPASGEPLGEQRGPLTPRPGPHVADLTGGEHVKRNIVKTVDRVLIAAEDRAADRGEVLHRSAVAIAKRDQLAVKHPTMAEVLHHRCQQLRRAAGQASCRCATRRKPDVVPVSRRSRKPSYLASNSQPGPLGQFVMAVASIGSGGMTPRLEHQSAAAHRRQPGRHWTSRP